MPLRHASATARTQLAHTAADRWGLNASDVTVSDGVVTAPDGRSAAFLEAAWSYGVPSVPDHNRPGYTRRS